MPDRAEILVPMMDMRAQHRETGEAVETAAINVLRSGRHIMGPHVRRLEQELAALCDTQHAVGVSSGTDALLMALMAIGAGPGDEVITTTYSFFATGGAIARTGATPRFVDIDPDTFNIDPERVQAAITPATKAIIAVHLFGQCAAMDRIAEMAARHQITVLEDAAQAIGATYDGRMAGSMGDIGCFSFFPSKNLGAAGDGGLVTTSDFDMARTLRRLRDHGAHPKYHHALIGGNFRLDEIQAAILLAKLDYLNAWTEARRNNAKTLTAGLERAQRLGVVRLPVTDARCGHVFNQFTVLAECGRDRLTDALDRAGIGWAVYYPVCLHLQECFADLGGAAGDCPVAEATSRKALSLPIHPWLTPDQIDRIVKAVDSL